MTTKFLIEGNKAIPSIMPLRLEVANPTHIPPEELGDILSGSPGRLLINGSTVPAFGPDK